VAKCAPPLRRADEQLALWDELIRGRVDIVASDHSPAPPSMKSGDFVSAWGGISGVQSTLAVLLEKGCHERALPLERITSLVAAEPARRFGIRGKGSVTMGSDADLALVDLGGRFTLAAGDLHQRHTLSPYLGSSFRGSVRRTIRRGATIFADGRIAASSGGRLVRPT
jgi:allantoinase